MCSPLYIFCQTQNLYKVYFRLSNCKEGGKDRDSIVRNEIEIKPKGVVEVAKAFLLPWIAHEDNKKVFQAQSIKSLLL